MMKDELIQPFFDRYKDAKKEEKKELLKAFLLSLQEEDNTDLDDRYN